MQFRVVFSFFSYCQFRGNCRSFFKRVGEECSDNFTKPCLTENKISYSVNFFKNSFEIGTQRVFSLKTGTPERQKMNELSYAKAITLSGIEHEHFSITIWDIIKEEANSKLF